MLIELSTAKARSLLSEYIKGGGGGLLMGKLMQQCPREDTGALVKAMNWATIVLNACREWGIPSERLLEQMLVEVVAQLREEILAKMEAGTLTVADLTDPNVLEVAKAYLQEKHPDLYEETLGERLVTPQLLYAAIRDAAAQTGS